MEVYDKIERKEEENRQEEYIFEEYSKEILDIILNRNNHDLISLTDRKGRIYIFEQVAVIPYEKGDDFFIYAILEPKCRVKGCKDGEALVFYVAEDEFGEIVLKMETDDRMSAEIFNRYYDLLDADLSVKEEAFPTAEFMDIQNKKKEGGKI